MPDNRAMATAILLLGFLVFGLTVRKARKQIPSIIRSVAGVAWLFALYLVAAALMIWGAWSVNLWTADLWWSTAIVVLGLGVGLVSSAVDSRSVRALRHAIAGKTVASAVFLGLYVNLATFPLIVEIALQALAAPAAMLVVVADHQGQKPARRLAEVVLSIIGLAVVAQTTAVLTHGMPGSDWLGLLKQVLLSIWFPFALVPFLYAVAYFGTAEDAVVGVRIVAPRDTRKWPITRRFLLAFRFRLSLAAAFDREWGRRYANAGGPRERRVVLARFRQVERPKFSVPRRSALARLKHLFGRSDKSDFWDGRAMPRDPAHLAQMLDSEPPGWEWMAFGAHLWIGMASQRHRYRGHQRRRAVRDGRERRELQASMPHLADEINSVSRLAESIVDVLSEERQERAFGPDGEPGSQDEIRQMADDFLNLHMALMDWGARLRGSRVHFRHRRAYRAASRLMDGPIEQLRHFVASLAGQLDRVPGNLASSSPHQLSIVLTVALSVRPEDLARRNRALARLGHTTVGALPEPHRRKEPPPAQRLRR